MSIPTGKTHAALDAVPRLRPIHPDALELVADMLLESAGQDEEYPAYREDQLARKGLRPGRRWQGCRPYTCVDVLLSSELDDLSRSAGLADDEHSAWRMYLEGLLPEEIAEALGTTRPTAVRLVHSARSRVARCSSKSRGLCSAYLSLMHRNTYRRPISDDR